MVAVVLLLQPLVARLLGHARRSCQFTDLGVEHVVDFLAGNAAYSGVGFQHRDVLQVVQVAEHADLRELRHAGEEGQLDVAVLRLADRVEGLQRVAVFLLQRGIVECLKQGLVVFVHEDGHAVARLLAGPLHDIVEAPPRRAVVRVDAVEPLPLFQMAVEKPAQRLRLVKLLGVHVKMQHGPRRPLRLQAGDGQAFEQLALALEVGLQGGDEQRLAEPTRAAQEVVAARGHHPVHQRRLVHIDISVHAQTLETLYANRIFHIRPRRYYFSMKRATFSPFFRLFEPTFPYNHRMLFGCPLFTLPLTGLQFVADWSPIYGKLVGNLRQIGHQSMANCKAPLHKRIFKHYSSRIVHYSVYGISGSGERGVINAITVRPLQKNSTVRLKSSVRSGA